MTVLEILFMVGGVVAVATIGFRIWVKWTARRQASAIVGDIFPVWACQGPFENGVQSAVAMRYAWLAVSGDRGKVDGMKEQFVKHASAYDANPREWEETRCAWSESTNARLSSYVAEARRLRAVEAWLTASFEFDNLEAVRVLGLDAPYTAADVERAYQAKSRQLCDDPADTALLDDAYRRARRLAQLSEAAGLDRFKERGLDV